jgi:hypothetical protein
MSPVPPELRFCRFRTDAPKTSPEYQRLPSDGMCLSVFLLLHEARDGPRVLVGEPDPAAPLEKIGALSSERIASGHGWMLPASHLRMFEGPAEAAARILHDQLGIPDIPLRGPTVISDAYGRPGREGEDPHWDLDFLFSGQWPAGRALPGSPWRRTEFVDVRQTSRQQYRRGHGDVLAFAGFSPRD